MKIRTILATLTIFTISAGLIACSKNTAVGPDYSTVPAPYDTTGKPKTVQKDGLIYYQIQDGYGPFTVHPQDQISIEYTGRTTDGKIFDSTYEKSNQGVPYIISLASVGSNGNFTYVRGFREGIVGMKKGGERTLVIPPSLGYGGTTNHLAKDTLIFDIKIVDISQ